MMRHPLVLRRVLMVSAVLGFTWLSYRELIAPLNERAAEFQRERADLQGRLDSAHRLLGAIKDAEQKLGYARGDLNQLVGEGTGESVMVTFPENIAQYFSGFGFPSAIVRLVTAQKEPFLPRYQRVYWSVGVPIPKTDRNLGGLLRAVVDLEQKDRFIKVIDFAVQPDPEDPAQRVASVNLLMLARE